VQTNGDVQFRYSGEEYEISLGLANHFTDASAPIGFMSGSYSVEADIHQLGGADPSYGLMFEHPESWYAYWFTVTPQSQEYDLWVSDNGQLTLLASGTSAYINSGDATNHLKAERRGSSITISANGHPFTTVTDSTHQGGEVGVTEWAGDGVPAVARFDNFAVRRLGGAAGAVQPAGERSDPYDSIPIPAGR
jgi:hypothetical protein